MFKFLEDSDSDTVSLILSIGGITLFVLAGFFFFNAVNPQNGEFRKCMNKMLKTDMPVPDVRPYCVNEAWNKNTKF